MKPIAAPPYLQSPELLDWLGLSAQQKQKVLTNRAELAEKIHQLDVRAFEDVIKILTPEQLEKLKRRACAPPGTLMPVWAPQKK
jgi:hypothetical protein